MVPRTFPSTYQTANGETRMVVFFLSSVSGLRKWVDYIPVKFTMLETQVNNSYNNNGVILVDPLSSTTNRQAWVDYVPVFVDANDTAAWRVDANGFIPVGFSTKPTLNLDFAGTKTLDSRITFTRASNATYFDANGVMQTAGSGVARFDHNPTTLQSLGLLIEEQRTNLVTYSSEFDNAAWSKTNATVTANAVVALDGTLTGDKLIATSTNGTHSVTIGTVTSGTAYAFSVYAKAGEYSQLQLSGMGVEGQGFNTVYNLATQTVTSAPTGSSITAVGNGWYRCVLVVTASATAGPIIRIRDAAGSNSFAGNDSDGIFLWGAQLEAGSFPTSYIPTDAVTATRNADAASMTGTNFSSWYNATEGTVYAEAVGINNISGATRRYAEISDGTTSERFIFGYSAAAPFSTRLLVTDSTTQADINVNTGLSGTPLIKMAAVYKINDFQQASNGTLGTADTSGTLPTVNQMVLGSDYLSTANTIINGHIRRIAYYPVRLSNDQLQALTR
jgi:hypothetical protein